MLDDALSFTDGWTLSEDQLAAPRALTDVLFTTSNGYVGVRGRRREPLGPDGGGVLVSGLYETRPYAHAEGAYGMPADYQTLVEVTDPTFVSISVDGVALAGDVGTWLDHRRTLDLRTGCVVTTGRWRSPTGLTVTLRSRRMASLHDPGVLWTSIDVEPSEPATVEIVTEARANTGDRTFPGEPEALSRAWGRVLVPAGQLDRDGLLGLVHRAPLSGRTVAVVTVGIAALAPSRSEVQDDCASRRFRQEAAPDRPLEVDQCSAFADGPEGDAEAVLVRAAKTAARAARLTFDEAVAHQRASLDDFWDAAVVDIDGDPELEAAVRFSTFQMFQASVGNPERAAPAKGLSGQGYQGHHLWDQEIYVAQVLSALAPDVARRLLSFRHHTLPAARARARELSLGGAQFPWRTIDGTEASGFFPAGSAQHHVNADIAWAVDHHVSMTGDDAFMNERGLALLVETARMWMSIGHVGDDGRFRIAGVTGPDEYTALVDNNLYTNAMAAWNLEAAATRCEAARGAGGTQPCVEELGVGDGEIREWKRAASTIYLPYDEDLGIHAQDDTFLRRARWDLAATPSERFPLQDHHHLLHLYRHQVVKQADVVLAMFLQADRFPAEQRLRNLRYYEPLTTHDSSLSAPIHAIVCAGVGDVEGALRYTRDAALTDLDARHGTPGDGLHIAAAAGAWLAIACGFGGMAVRGSTLGFWPQLPPEIPRLRFRVRFRGTLVEVEVDPRRATYRNLEGGPVTLLHGRDELHLPPGGVATRDTGQPSG